MARDIAAALKALVRTPIVTALVILMLALGIGATTALFSIIDVVLLRPLPYPNADRFVALWTASEMPDGRRLPGVLGAALPLLETRTDLFAAVHAYRFGSAVVSGGAEPAVVGSPEVAPGLLSMLGATPIVGRLLTDTDAVGVRAVMIGERFWISQFGSDPGVVGRTIWVDDQPSEVVGVMPRSFRFPEANIDIWRPLERRSLVASRQRVQVLGVRARGVTADDLRRRLQALSGELAETGALVPDQVVVSELPLQVTFGRDSGGSLLIVFGIVALVLAIACLNVANLLLVRATSRHTELAIRSAMGATAGALIRSTAAESLLLTAAGGLAGALVASNLLAVMALLTPPQITFLSAAATMNWRSFACAAGLSALTCVIVTILPAWRTSRVDAREALTRGSRGVAGGGDDRWQGALVAAQLALVIVVLAAGGLLLRSFGRLMAVDSGFTPDGLVAIDVELPTGRYPTGGMGLAAMRDVVDRIESLGDFEVALSGGMSATRFGQRPEAEGGPIPDPQSLPTIPTTAVSPDFFATMRLPLRMGRTFRSDEGDDVIVVTESLSRQFWGEASPVGRRFRLTPDQPWRTIVGVAGDITRPGLDAQVGRGMEIYEPHRRDEVGGGFILIARTPRSPAAALALMKQQVWAMDARVPVSEASTMEERLRDRLLVPQFLLRVTSGFAVVALLLAGVGVYGVTAFWVSRRRRELAVRVALGATQGAIVTRIVGRGLTLAAAGALGGVATALLAARAVEPWLFATNARDPFTLAAVTLAAIGLAGMACCVPAVRASRADPMSWLRDD